MRHGNRRLFRNKLKRQSFGGYLAVLFNVLRSFEYGVWGDVEYFMGTDSGGRRAEVCIEMFKFENFGIGEIINV